MNGAVMVSTYYSIHSMHVEDWLSVASLKTTTKNQMLT